MEIKENSLGYKILKALGIALLVSLVCLMVWQAFGTMLPGLLPLLREGNDQAIADYLAQAGEWKGMLCVFALAIMQVISVVLPGAAIQIAAGAIYGWWKGFLICYVGYWFANVMVFLFARRVKNHMLENASMGNKSAWLIEKLNSANPEFVIGIACLMPGVPNGIVPYVAARSKITTKGFALAVAASCWLPILCFCLSGGFLLQGEYLFGVGIVVLQLIIIGIIIWKREWLIAKWTKVEEDSHSPS